MKKRSLFLIAALILISINLRPAITSVAPIVESLEKALGMNATAAGLLTSIPVFCMGIFSPLAVKMSRRFTSNGVLLMALILIGLATALRLVTGSSVFLLITAFAAGFGIAIASPLVSGFIKENFPGQVAAMIGVYTVSMAGGAALSSGLTAPLEKWLDGSWRLALSSWALFAVIALPIWILVIRRNRDKTGAKLAEVHKLPLGKFRPWLLTLFFGLMSTMFYTTTAWLAPIAQGMGLSKIEAGAVLTVFTAVQLPSNLLMPILAHRFNLRLVILIGCSLGELAGLTLLMTQTVPPSAAAVLIGLGAGGLFPMALMLPIDETRTPEEANAWAAMTQSIGYVIAALGPLVAGFLHDLTGNYSSTLMMMIAIVVVMIVIQVLIGVTGKKTATD